MPVRCVQCVSYNEGFILYEIEVHRIPSIGTFHQALLRLSMMVGGGCGKIVKSLLR